MGALAGVFFAALMAMPNRKGYASGPRWLSRAIRTSGFMYGTLLAGHFFFANRLGDDANLAVSIALLLSAVLMATSVIAAKARGAGGI